MNEIPRRVYVDRLTPAETAIRNAVMEVEKVGADVRLTDAVILLGAAADSVADYVDGIESIRRLVVTEKVEPEGEAHEPEEIKGSGASEELVTGILGEAACEAHEPATQNEEHPADPSHFIEIQSHEEHEVAA